MVETNHTQIKVGTNESKSGNTNHTNEKAYASARRGVKDCPLRKTTGSLGINHTVNESKILM